MTKAKNRKTINNEDAGNLNGFNENLRFQCFSESTHPWSVIILQHNQFNRIGTQLTNNNRDIHTVDNEGTYYNDS